MNFYKLNRDLLIILSVLTILSVSIDFIFKIMNMSSFIAYIGPMMLLIVISTSIWFILNRVKSIRINYKKSKQSKQSKQF
jgi:hypothetical protein